jgi:hypothetical protein
MWVLDLYLPQNDVNYLKPLIYSCPKTLMDEIITQSHRAEADSYVDASDPFVGAPVYFTRIGTGLKTKYTGVQLGQQAWPLPVELIDLMKPFADVLVIPTSDEVKAAYLGERVAVHAKATPPECYGQEYGSYADCPSCSFKGDCEATFSANAIGAGQESPADTPQEEHVQQAPPAPVIPAAPATKPAPPRPPAPPAPPAQQERTAVKPPAPPAPVQQAIPRPPIPNVPPPRNEPAAARPSAPAGVPPPTSTDSIRQRLRETIAKRQAAKS